MALEEIQNGSATSENNKLMDKSKMANGATDIINVDQIKKIDPNTEFLRAARAGDMEKIIEFLESGEVTDIDTSNANGLNALHLASKDGHVEVVKELLKRGASVNNATKKKNTALHIASLAGQKEVIKLLLQHNADVNVRSLNGFTPLYMAAQENHDTCVRYLLAKGSNQGLTTDDGFTPLAVAMQQGHEKVVAVLLENDSRSKVRLPALHIAAKKDDIKAATLLLENEHNPDIASKSGFTPLHIAAHYGNIKIANLLISKGADVNFQAKHNITPLHVACKWGKVNMVELLISKGAKIDTTTRDGLTPMHCAARNGNEEVINILLENKAQILSKTKNGLTPLHMAAQGEHVDAARNLLNHKAPVDEVTGDYLTALHVASHCGHVKVAKLLLDRDADPNARALNGFTPLHIACKKNRIKVVELLLKHGASISATTESGLTPLHVASFMGCMNIVIYLLQCDASPDIPTVRGETPLHLAARANQTDVVRILLRNGAQVDTKAREEQTPLHVASRLGNIDIVMLLLQHGANVDSPTKDQYTPLHIAAKEGQEEIAAALIENGASLDATTKKGFTPLHLAAKYGNIKVVQLLLQKGAKVDAQGKNGVTPLHVANHYNHEKVALLLLENGASPHACAKNGHTPLHIAAKKNQMEIATKLLEYGAQADAESKSGFTPLHLAAQEGHAEMVALLLEHKAEPDHQAKNGLTPLHLCAQEDRVEAAKLLIDHNGKIDPATKAGYTPLHVAAHFGQVNMVKFLLENDANIEMSTNIGYRPLHQAAQQGHTLIINILLKNKADPNALTNNGQTALNIADKLGYITVVETLKIVTETSVTNNAPTGADEKYKVVAPEAMHENFISDSEDEGEAAEDPAVYDNFNYNYVMDDMKNTSDDHHHMGADSLHDADKLDSNIPHEVARSAYQYNSKSVFDEMYDETPVYGADDSVQEITIHVRASRTEAGNSPLIITALDNVDIPRNPINVGLQVLNALMPCLESFGGHKKISPMSRESFLVSFLVDARGGAMRGCRHSGVRVIVPPQSAAQPTRITCRYVKPQRTPNPPPLMEGEALVSRILELGPIGAKFLGPVILEVPHFASLRDKEREIVILRSDNGETWREHTLVDSEEAIQHVLNHCFEGDEFYQLEDLHTNRITRIVTNDFPHFFAVISRVRQEVHAIGPEGGTVSSSAVPQVQAVFPANALTKRIKVGLQAQPIDSNNTAKLLGRGVAVSPVVTVEPRRRKFHKAITLSMPAPKAHTQGMINQYSGSENAPTLRLLCSITGGQSRAIWEDVTGSTPLTFVKDCVSFTTTVSARFWLMDCINISEATKMASELYNYNSHVPFMVKFVVFAKRIDPHEAKLSVFCMTDDKEDKTLEQQEHFTEIAKSRDVEVLEGRTIYLEFAGNLIPILKSGDQLNMEFNAFKENRLAFTVRVKDQDDQIGRILFMNEPKVAKGEAAQTPICTLNVALPEKIIDDEMSSEHDTRSLEKNYRVFFDKNLYSSKNNEIQRGDIRLSDICNLLGPDWEKLAKELEIDDTDIELIKNEYPGKDSQQAMIMLRLWLRRSGKQATGNNLEQALHRIRRSDIVDKCIFNLELVTDEMEKAVAKMQLDQSGFDNLKEELGPSRDTSLHRNTKMDPTYCSEMLEKLENHIYKTEPNNVNGNRQMDDSNDDQERNEDIQKLRTENLGIQSKSDRKSTTPPPSPAEFEKVSQNGAQPIIDTNKLPPTAVQELHEDEENAVSEEEDDDRPSSKSDDITKIPAKTSTPIKVKTIKKHSKVNVELKKQPPTTRPAVGDIEWDIRTEEADYKPDGHPIEISSETLEDITQSNRSSNPIILGNENYVEPKEEVHEEVCVQKFKRRSPENGENIINEELLKSTNGEVKSEFKPRTAPRRSQEKETPQSPEKRINSIREVNPDGSENIITIIETTWPNGEVTTERQTVTVPANDSPKHYSVPGSPEFVQLQRQTSIRTRTIREKNPDGSENVVEITETTWPNGEVTTDRKVISGRDPGDIDMHSPNRPEVIVRETNITKNTIREINPDGTENVVVITETTAPNGDVTTQREVISGQDPGDLDILSRFSPQINIKETNVRRNTIREINPDGTENVVMITETTLPNGEVKTERKVISGQDPGNLDILSQYSPKIISKERSIKTNTIREVNPDGTENIVTITETTLPNGEVKTERKVISGQDPGDFNNLSKFSPEYTLKETSIRTNTIREVNPDGTENVVVITETTLPSGEIKTERKVISGQDPGELSMLSQMSPTFTVKETSIRTNTIREVNPDGSENVVVITETTLPNGEIKTERKVISGEDPGDLDVIAKLHPEMLVKQQQTSVRKNTVRELNPDGTENIIEIIETTWPNGEVTTERQTITKPAGKGHGNSESDNSENQDGLQQKQTITPNAKGRTLESSSGSDVALHEPGTELSDDETDFYHNNEHPHTFTETVERTEYTSPENSKESMSRTVTTTTTLTSEQIPSDIQDTANNDTETRESLQKLVDKFMVEERKNF